MAIVRFVSSIASCRFTDERLTADEMDQQRIQNVAYQYLCRLEEAKRYIIYTRSCKYNVYYQHICLLEEVILYICIYVMQLYDTLSALSVDWKKPRVVVLLLLLCFVYIIFYWVFVPRWMEACLGEEIPAPTELEEALRNGVWLAKLAHRFSPNTTPLRKIYDSDQARYQVCCHL